MVNVQPAAHHVVGIPANLKSRFYINIGTPPQYFHVLPSFDGQTIYVPISDDCARLSVTECGALRGVETFSSKASPGFQTNVSTTWNEIGIYELDIGKKFGLDGNTLYGYDTAGVSLSNEAADNVTMSHQALSAYASPDSWLGKLGVSQFDITVNDTEKPRSLLTALKEENHIPSLSFGYQAGAAYRKPSLLKMIHSHSTMTQAIPRFLAALFLVATISRVGRMTVSCYLCPRTCWSVSKALL